MEFYLVSTDHLSDALWFKDDEDFKAGMNQVAVVTNLTGICVLAFTLMSNHVHFVLQSTREDAVTFINRYKQQYSNYFQERYGTSHLLRRNHADVRALSVDGESLERGIAYTLMNAVAANICQHPTGYRWCSADTLFRERPPHGVMIRDLSFRQQTRLLHSNVRLDPEWIMGDEGYVLPDSFIAVRFVESLFRTPGRLNYFLSNSSKAKVRLEKNGEGLPSFKDQIILSAVPDLCHSLFRKARLEQVNDSERAELIRQLRFRFSADIHQIARILGIPYPECVKLLDTI